MPESAGELLVIDNFETKIDPTISRRDPNKKGIWVYKFRRKGDKDEMSKQEVKPKKEKNSELSPLIKYYGVLLSKCISISSSSESSDAHYALNQLDQQLRVIGLRATIKMGIEKKIIILD